NGLIPELKAFILNPEHLQNLSETPEKAIVSLKTNRGTSYAAFIQMLDEIKGAYYEIYAERVSLTPEEYLALDTSDPVEFELFENGRAGIPMNISIAEPN